MFTPLFLLVALLPAVDGPPVAAVRLYRPGDMIPHAVADAKAQPVTAQQYLLYISLSNERPENLASATLNVDSVLNRLSQKPSFYHAVPVAGSDGRLLRANLYDFGIRRKDVERLISVGSGRVPQPESYHYQLIEKTFVKTVEKVWQGGVYPVDGQYYPAGRKYEVDEKHTEKTLALASWLPTEPTKDLVSLTQTPYPIVRGDWFVYYSLLEPRYHELLQLGETLDELFDHLGVDRRRTDKAGAETRGVVLHSEVAIHNRALNRYPTLHLRGRGVLWVSDDFNTSVGDDDLLSNVDQLLDAKPAAHEVLWTLPNGLMGAQVYNGEGKRLDRADTNIAIDRRNKFQTVDVEIRNCFACHSTAGFIDVADEVRTTARDKIAVAVEQLKRKSERQAQRLADRFFVSDISDEITQDNDIHSARVKALTGRAAAADGLSVLKMQLRYEAPRTLADLAFETGYPAETIKAVLERSAQLNLDHSVIALLREKPRPGTARVDQLERRGFADIMSRLALVPEKKEKKP